MMSASESLHEHGIRDCIWRGYDPRALMPIFAVAVVISLTLLAGRWLSTDLSEFADRTGSLVLFLPVALMWVLLFIVGLYRTVTFTYRLTGKAIFVDRGFRWMPEAPMPLLDIDDVRAINGTVGRWFGVGRVVLLGRGGRLLTISGVAQPQEFADAIRLAVSQARHQQD